MKPDKEKNEKSESWEPMKISYVGHVTEVLQMPGSGKQTAPEHDSGDAGRKPPGQE